MYQCDRVTLMWVLGLVMAVQPAAVSAQEPPPGPPQQAEPTELVYEREIFSYPRYERRNPFRPLLSSDEGAPRFEQLRVLGIIYSAVPGASVATLGTSTVQVSEDGTQTTVSTDRSRSWYLKAGQSIGNIRVVEIRRDQVIVDVTEFGLPERKIMEFRQNRPGGVR
ncbi:MAG: hypothetical protein OEZ65_04570 [Gemmatimonadota bacterium]|nr:hypothetical protein [Gemmatimonadota bacterium]MDH5758839.1 hypothetical protein [Gemmatimonadota bacterium]